MRTTTTTATTITRIPALTTLHPIVHVMGMHPVMAMIQALCQAAVMQQAPVRVPVIWLTLNQMRPINNW